MIHPLWWVLVSNLRRRGSPGRGCPKAMYVFFAKGSCEEIWEVHLYMKVFNEKIMERNDLFPIFSGNLPYQRLSSKPCLITGGYELWWPLSAKLSEERPDIQSSKEETKPARCLALCTKTGAAAMRHLFSSLDYSTIVIKSQRTARNAILCVQLVFTMAPHSSILHGAHFRNRWSYACCACAPWVNRPQLETSNVKTWLWRGLDVLPWRTMKNRYAYASYDFSEIFKFLFHPCSKSTLYIITLWIPGVRWGPRFLAKNFKLVPKHPQTITKNLKNGSACIALSL